MATSPDPAKRTRRAKAISPPPPVAPVAASSARERPAAPVDEEARRLAAEIDEDKPLAVHAPAAAATAEPEPSTLGAILSTEPVRGAATCRRGRIALADLPATGTGRCRRRPRPRRRRGRRWANSARHSSRRSGRRPARTSRHRPSCRHSTLRCRTGTEPLDLATATSTRRSGAAGHASHDARADGSAAKPRASLADTLETFGITRRCRVDVGGGAAIAGLGFSPAVDRRLGGTGALLDS